MEPQEALQISPGQLQSELESIRSLRRISLSHSSPDLDPDLPSSLQNNLIMSNSDNPNNSNNLTTTTTIQQPASNPDSSSSTGTHNNKPIDQATDEPHPDLFWLPARLHPEIAPQEFKAFIEEATKPENLLRRTSSALGSRRNSINSGGLSRKKSMLSQVYDPTEDQHLLSSSLPRPDKPITRGYSMSSPRNLGRGAQGLESLTINDLQRLESLVFKKSPSSSNEPSLDTQFQHLNLNDDRIRAVISRSMSIGGSANSPCGPEASPEQLDPEAIDDSPLISRAPGHIIRRTARTKVRKTSLPGDGNGHRFPATRRPQAKSSMANSHHPRNDSTTSNDSEEALSNDLHSNRSSKECARQSLPGSSTCTEDLTHAIDAHKSLPVSLAAAISSTSGTLDHSSEDDQSLDSTSRPGSLASNSSLLDAYAYEGPSTDDPLKPTVHPSSFDFSDLIAPSNLDFTVPHPIKYPGQSSSSELPQPRPVQAPSSDLIDKPSSAEPGIPSPDAPTKPDALRVSTDLQIPVLQRSTRSSDDLHSTSASANSAISSSTVTTFSTTASSGTLPSSSPSTPVGSQTSRPPLTTTKTSPNLSTPATSVIPSPQAPSSPGPKEGKEKKRAWVKLGLASAVSTSSKNKKEKAKDKQKATEPDGSTSGQPMTVAPPGGSNNGGTTGVGQAKKETGFLSGLFGGKSRKNESDQEKQTSSSGPPGLTGNPKHPGAVPGGVVGLGRASAETQTQQQLINPTASGGYIKGRFMSFYRLPIHVERAVYRLSHIKLANPRRPLYEQVLISNLMFWYLGVINKSQAPTPIKNNNINTSQQPVSSSSSSTSSSSPTPSGSSKKQGNARTGKTKNNNSNVPSSHHAQQNQRGPGVKKWGNNKGGDGEKLNGKSKAAAGRKGPKKVRSGWTDGDSSDSDSSDEDGRPRNSAHRQADHDGSDSDSDSSDHLQSSSDDDEKPLGSRIRSKHIPMPSSSPQSATPLSHSPHPPQT